MPDVLCGVALLLIGYYIGLKQRPKAEATPLTEDEKRAEEKTKEQWEKLLNFSGKGGVTDE